MKTLTKRQALKECATLWNWLAKNPGKNKSDYPRDAFKNYAHRCPCCAYVFGIKYPGECDLGPDMQCAGEACCGLNPEWLSLCPLKRLWPKGCCDGSSPFDVWTYGSEKERKQSAQKIAKAAERELAKLEAQTKGGSAGV